MPKITDDSFYLPEIYPTNFNDNLNNSANKPILISGLDKRTGDRDDYVVKLRAAERMQGFAFMRELLGSFIALQLDINTFHPAIIDISTEFLSLLIGNDAYGVAQKSIGYNFGTKYEKAGFVPILTQPLNQSQLNHAQNIFLFDLLIQNNDRTDLKPNMLTNGTEIMVFDHELAFGFIYDIFPGKPGTFRESDRKWINNHCLLKLISGKGYDFESFETKLESIDEDFWNKAWELIPNEWRDGDNFIKIKDYISATITNKKEFTEELKLIMS
ncbi:HipA family kinase [Chitinophaga sp. NPDC101104]|uniref:HipA family kinase n=1 Tax=Chitinophaga sp. NPDC101104 TaxID=3390561 RepID=UPI003D07CD67